MDPQAPLNPNEPQAPVDQPSSDAAAPGSSVEPTGDVAEAPVPETPAVPPLDNPPAPEPSSDPSAPPSEPVGDTDVPSDPSAGAL